MIFWWTRALATIVLALGYAPYGMAQAPMYGPGGPMWGYPPLYGEPCAAPCPDARALRRELRREAQRQEGARAVAPAPPAPRTPPPTRVEEIRPEYEAASQIREEFSRSGERR